MALCSMLHRSNLLAFVGGGVNPKFSEISGKFILYCPDVRVCDVFRGFFFEYCIHYYSLFILKLQFCLSYHNLLIAQLVKSGFQSRVSQTRHTEPLF